MSYLSRVTILRQTRKMAIANGTCVSFCNQPKAHFGLWVRTSDNHEKFTWIKREFNACQTHRNMYPSIFNRLRAKARYWSQIATFSYPPCIECPRWGVPIGIPGKSLVLIKLESWGYQAVKTV